MPIIRCVLPVLALIAWTASSASAQSPPCDESQFHATTNMWKLEPDQNASQVPAGELPAERKVMRRVLEMFTSAFVPTGAAGLYGVNYDIVPHAVTNKSRYGNTYTFTLSNHKIECHLKEGIALPQANAEGIREFNFVDGTTVWWLTRAGALPFRFVTRREFLSKQIEIVGSKSRPSPGLLAYYQRLLGDATDDVAFVKEAQVPGLTETGFVFTTLEDRANRIYVTVNPDYYDRSQPKSAPQHMLIRLKRGDLAFLNGTGNGARHLESIQKLRDIVRANLPELRAMVK
jgi:hypothetical protein